VLRGALNINNSKNTKKKKWLSSFVGWPKGSKPFVNSFFLPFPFFNPGYFATFWAHLVKNSILLQILENKKKNKKKKKRKIANFFHFFFV